MQSDWIIIGGGPGGYEVAADLANKGLSVTLIERDLLGGTCLNRGCIPTKCLCAGASLLLELSEASHFGITIGDVKAEYGAAVRRAAEVKDRLREGVAMMLSKVHVVHGEAVICPDHVVKVGDEGFTAPNIIIATGSRPAVLPIPGAELAITSDQLLQLEEMPQRIVIIGGGVIGIEFASILSAYGREVTVIEFCKEILPPFDAEIAKRLRSMLSRRGVKFLLSSAVKAIEPGLQVHYEGRKGADNISCDLAVMAVGRKPVLPQGVSEAGIETDGRGFIKVDDMMLTSQPGIYAVGDVNGRCMLAHAASAQARRAIGEQVNLDIVPSAVFSEPEAAMVGLTEDLAAEHGHDLMIGKASYAANGKALAMGCDSGSVKMIFDRQSGMLLGCHVVGAHASDLVAEAAALMEGMITREQIAGELIHGHPTISEMLMLAAKNTR